MYKTLKTPPKKNQPFELTTELSKNAGYKINIQKSVVFLNNEREIKNDPIHNHIKKNKIPMNNFN